VKYAILEDSMTEAEKEQSANTLDNFFYNRVQKYRCGTDIF